MKRNHTDKRNGWEDIVSKQGLLFHTVTENVVEHGGPAPTDPYRSPGAKSHPETRKVAYWDESVFYSFQMEQILLLEKRTNELHQMCLDAVQHVIDNKRYAELHIPEIAIPLIEYSWNNETPAIYGRFDFMYDGRGEPKMLEYNADTPTSLLEAAVIQWYWKEDKFKKYDQFNSIHERLVAKWKELKDYLMAGPLYFAHMDDWEDAMNSAYMADTASQAGIEIDSILIPDIGWHSIENIFVDVKENTMRNIFKLYPWEWLLKDEYGKNIAKVIEDTVWIEPTWKMILSNKGILPILWELFPNHPNLLKASFKNDLGLDNYVTKPYLSREGQNVTIVENSGKTSNPGSYGDEGLIYQELAKPAVFDGAYYPVIGSWVIDGQSAGMGIRESNTPITGNRSRFVPHVIEV